MRGPVAAALIGVAAAACTPADAPPEETSFNGTPPAGFGAVTLVDLAPGTYARGTSFDSSQPDLVIDGGSYPVRPVSADRVRIGFSGYSLVGPDGTATIVPSPPAYTTEPSVRVGGTDEKLVAVFAVLAYCGRPIPDAATIYAWGDEPVMRADDTGEWQFTGLC